MVEGKDFNPKTFGLHRVRIQYTKVSSELQSRETHLETVGSFFDLPDLGSLPSLLVIIELELNVASEDFLWAAKSV